MKKCGACKAIKDKSKFSKDVHRVDNLAFICKPCSSKKSSEWNKRNPIKRRLNSKKNKLKTQYGLTIEQLEKMKVEQNNSCSICNRQVRLVVDHSHVTGYVRSLLCNNCNMGIGYFAEDSERLKNAILYLEKHANT